MPDEIEYPGVYVDEAEGPASIDGVPTSGRRGWLAVARPAALAVGIVAGLRILRRRRRRAGDLG